MKVFKQVSETIFKNYLLKHRVRKYVKYNMFFMELQEWEMDDEDYKRTQVSEREALEYVRKKYKDYL